MHKQVKGVFRNGKVELTEAPPADVRQAEVVVTFLPPEVETGAAGQYIRYGMFSGPGLSTEEDFKAAEWHGDPDLDADMPDAP